MLDDRFWSKVDKTDSCWNWTAGVSGRRYGEFCINGKMIGAHRVSYEDKNGEIPKGLVIDHLCKNTLCVNADHLEVVTQKENIMRGAWFVSLNAVKTECPKGHEFTPHNTISYKRKTWTQRQCRICHNNDVKNYRLRLAKKIMEIRL